MKKVKDDEPFSGPVDHQSMYDKDELISSAKAFGVKPEVMAGAIKLAGKDSFTRAETEDAIKIFLERKVE